MQYFPRHDAAVSNDDLLGKVSFILRNGKKIEPSRKSLSERSVPWLGLAERSDSRRARDRWHPAGYLRGLADLEGELAGVLALVTQVDLLSATVEIAGVPVLMRTGDPDFLRSLQDRYPGF